MGSKHKTEPVIWIVSNQKYSDLGQSIGELLISAFERVRPQVNYFKDGEIISALESAKPDLVIICNWDLGPFTAYEVVKYFPGMKFIILIDEAVRSQSETTGARLVRKVGGFKIDLFPEVVDLLTQ